MHAHGNTFFFSERGGSVFFFFFFCPTKVSFLAGYFGSVAGMGCSAEWKNKVCIALFDFTEEKKNPHYFAFYSKNKLSCSCSGMGSFILHVLENPRVNRNKNAYLISDNVILLFPLFVPRE